MLRLLSYMKLPEKGLPATGSMQSAVASDAGSLWICSVLLLLHHHQPNGMVTGAVPERNRLPEVKHLDRLHIVAVDGDTDTPAEQLDPHQKGIGTLFFSEDPFRAP